ncbi:hypothetical protein AB0H36_38260 [Kribbella sp. NPDC050820]|uniref:hypothetical protein n=1 Tax=Kribbella sp. NPDC050820 TaxID=3155408 RepID=UPI0033D5452E
MSAQDNRTPDLRDDDVMTQNTRDDDIGTTSTHMDDMRTPDARHDDMDPTDTREGDASMTSERDASMTSGRGTEWTAVDGTQPLLAEDRVVDFRTRWEVIQQGFVDDPRQSVSEADQLVDDVLKRLSMSFEEQHQGLEKQWSDGEPSTEDLRSALQKYRAFFQRLLAM